MWRAVIQAEIEKTILGFANPLDDIDAFVADVARYASLGIDMVELMPLVTDPAVWANQEGGGRSPGSASWTPLASSTGPGPAPRRTG